MLPPLSEHEKQSQPSEAELAAVSQLIEGLSESKLAQLLVELGNTPK
jgi:hypothetical protein